MIHAPLANRLGIWQLKWELEDMSLRFLEPSAYRRISRLVAEKRSDRQSFIEKFMAELRHLVAEAGMESEVSGRVKHIYSIWRKMQNKGLDFHELFDIRAVRVMVDTVEQCYSVLGLVHTDRKSTRLNSSHVAISYAVFCLKKKNNEQSTIR